MSYLEDGLLDVLQGPAAGAGASEAPVAAEVLGEDGPLGDQNYVGATVEEVSKIKENLQKMAIRKNKTEQGERRG